MINRQRTSRLRVIAWVQVRDEWHSFRVLTGVCLVVALASLPAWAGSFVAFGPQTFTRSGAPVTETRSFSVRNPSAQYTLRVRNARTASARVMLNGSQVLGPDAFNANVDLIEIPVTLNPDNALSVELRSAPGSSIVIEIDGVDDDAPTISATITPAPNNYGWHNENVTVVFACRDATSPIVSCPSAVIVSDETSGGTASGETVDAAGNRTSTSVLIRLDKTPPDLTPSSSPSPNAGGWNNSPVVVSFTAIDALSGIVAERVTPPVMLSSEGANQSVTGQATDFAGNTRTVQLNGINIDLTAPFLTGSVAPPPNSNGWNNTPVTVHIDCADALSGVAACPPDQVFDREGANQSFSGTVSDRAGNGGSVSGGSISIDLTKPTITVVLSPQPMNSGVFLIPVTAHFTCSDPLSGVESCPPDQLITTPGVGLTVNGATTDRAGNTQSVASDPFTAVRATPTIAVTLTPAPNASGWNNTPVVAHFTCTELDTLLPGCPADQTISTEGANQTVTASVTDPFGQTASVTSGPFSIDMTAPLVTPSLEPLPNANGWNNGPVTAHFECSDAGSGVDVCPPDQTFGDDGTNLTITATVTDRAGNTASVTSAPFNIDRTNPTIGVTLSPALGPDEFAGEPVTGHFTCADSGSGVMGCPSDQVIDDEGTNLTISGSVTDRAGNTSTVTSPPFGIAFGPRIKDFSPRSGQIGTLVTLVGTKLAPNPRIMLSSANGAILAAQVAKTGDTTVSFVIPPGAVTGVITLTVGSDTTKSTSSLTITASTDFNVDVAPSSLDLMSGQSASFAVSLVSSNAFAQFAALEVAGLPSGVSATFAPARITAGQTSTLTLTAPIGQAAGPATLTVTASAIIDGIQLSPSAHAQLNIAIPTTSFVGRTVVADTLQPPLAGVTVTLMGRNGNGGTTACSGTTVSDGAGNFALTGLGAECVGPQLVGYDGTTATSPEGEYAGVNIVYTLTTNQVTASPVLVSLPRIDDKEAFLVQQNAAVDQIYKYESIPGLSVTVYRGTTFTLQDGSRPDPFRLVAVQVPVDRLPDQKPPIPTMLSAFIVAFQPANAVASQPAAVFYPNTLNTAPGVSMTMMTLDPTLGRMVPYGTATVSLNGTQITPDLDPSFLGHRYGIVHFDWHGPMPPPPPPDTPDRPEITPPEDTDSRCEVADPCNVATGLQTVRETDISISGSRGRIGIDRIYRTLAKNAGPFGIGTYNNYSYFLSKAVPQNELVVDLVLPEGRWLPFARAELGQPLMNSTSPALRGVILNTFPDGHAELRWKDGTVFRFSPATTITPPLESITDPNGNLVVLTRNAARPVQVTQITDAVGRVLTLTYDAANRITAITDPIGRHVQYAYNAAGTLEAVTDPEGGVTRYEYDAENRLLRQFDARGVRMSENTYEDHGRVAQQVQADGGVFRFGYVFLNPTVKSSPLLADAVTDPKGRTTTFRFSPAALLSDMRRPNGEVRALDRDVILGNVVVGRKTITTCVGCAVSQVHAGDETYEYDERGNVLQQANALGQTTTYTYDDVFNRVTSVTDPLGHASSYVYDARGNLVTATDANDQVTSYKYDVRGQLTETTDALGHVTKFRYDGFGNLMSMTDPLGNMRRYGYDGLSRLIEVIDPLGRRTRTEYDGLSRVVRQTDPNGNVTAFAYDPVGNLTSVTDARGKQTKFTYDSMNRLLTRTDPVGRAETRAYDLNGNLVSLTDRRGMMSTFVYDDSDHLIEEHYADGASVVRLYDANGRMVHVSDSASGAFTFNYDLANRLQASNAPTGSVRYLRDALGRVLQRQVVGQPAVAYVYEPTGNLASASMPDASVAYTYDALNRPVTMNRANGVRSDYAYDPVGRLLSIVHARGTTNLVSLGYAYDAAGGRVSQQSTAAQSPITQSSGDTTFDDANRMLQRGATNYTYDENGNLTTETGPNGTTTYVWDPRNRLARLIQPNGKTSEFTYDFAGMMIRQADSGPGVNLTRSFTLDELTNVAFQQSSDGGQLSVLTAQSIDTHLATRRSDGQAEYALVDAINSTVATIDQAGMSREQVSYDLFGQTNSPGTSFPFEFTGRAKVTDGLYYYRTRFYSVETGRFTSEDPIGYAGDLNLYRYAENNPVELNDPTGELTIPRRCFYVLGVLVCIGTGHRPPRLPPEPQPPIEEPRKPGGGKGGGQTPPDDGPIEIPSPSFSPGPSPRGRLLCPWPRPSRPSPPILGIRG